MAYFVSSDYRDDSDKDRWMAQTARLHVNGPAHARLGSDNFYDEHPCNRTPRCRDLPYYLR